MQRQRAAQLRTPLGHDDDGKRNSRKKMPGSQRGPEAAAVIALGLLAAPWVYRHYYADKHRHAHTRHTVSAPCLLYTSPSPRDS